MTMYNYDWPGTTSGTSTTFTLNSVERYDTWQAAMTRAAQITWAAGRVKVAREVTPFGASWVVRWLPHYWTTSATA